MPKRRRDEGTRWATRGGTGAADNPSLRGQGICKSIWHVRPRGAALPCLEEGRPRIATRRRPRRGCSYVTAHSVRAYYSYHLAFSRQTRNTTRVMIYNDNTLKSQSTIVQKFGVPIPLPMYRTVVGWIPATGMSSDVPVYLQTKTISINCDNFYSYRSHGLVFSSTIVPFIFSSMSNPHKSSLSDFIRLLYFKHRFTEAYK